MPDDEIYVAVLEMEAAEQRVYNRARDAMDSEYQNWNSLRRTIRQTLDHCNSAIRDINNELAYAAPYIGGPF